MGSRTEYHREYYRLHPRHRKDYMTPEQLATYRNYLKFYFRRYRANKKQRVGTVPESKLSMQEFIDREIKDKGLQTYMSRARA